MALLKREEWQGFVRDVDWIRWLWHAIVSCGQVAGFSLVR
jgi:hypothetical protein